MASISYPSIAIDKKERENRSAGWIGWDEAGLLDLTHTKRVPRFFSYLASVFTNRSSLFSRLYSFLLLLFALLFFPLFLFITSFLPLPPSLYLFLFPAYPIPYSHSHTHSVKPTHTAKNNMSKSEVGYADNIHSAPSPSSVENNMANISTGGDMEKVMVPVEDMSNLDESGLKRDLRLRHMVMIAISGTIGTGLFLTSGKTIATAGPLGARKFCLPCLFVVTQTWSIWTNA